METVAQLRTTIASIIEQLDQDRPLPDGTREVIERLTKELETAAARIENERRSA